MQNPCQAQLRIHKADPGKSFFQVDQAGAEALIVAYLLPPCRYRELFMYGIKPHIYTALNLYVLDWKRETPYDSLHFASLPIKDLAANPDWPKLSKIIKSNEERYFISKKTNHSLNYRKRASTLRFDILKESGGKTIISLSQSELFYSIYHGLVSELQGVWYPEIDEIAKTHRTLTNLFGFPCTFHGKQDDKLLREMTAWVPQSTVGTIANMAFIGLQDYIEETDKDEWDVLNNKHDSVLGQAPDEEVYEAARMLKALTEVELMSPRGEPFRMKAEVSIGKNWDKYDPEDNPDGMKEVNV